MKMNNTIRLKTIITASAVLLSTIANAQDGIGEVLSKIESNNLELKALLKQNEAEKYGYKSEGALEDPELGFAYLWSSPAEGPRQDYSVSQTIDLATLFGSKMKLAQEKGKMDDIAYDVARQKILLEAKMLCINLIYCNALAKELELRYKHAEEVSQAYEVMKKEGAADRSDLNQVRLALLSLESEIRKNNIERDGILMELSCLNGGSPISFDQRDFPEHKLFPSDFDTWYEEQALDSPTLAYVKQNVAVMEQELRTEKIANAPKITAGYMSEITKSLSFRGLSVGVTVPLWSVRNNVRKARAACESAELYQRDAASQYYIQLKRLYVATEGLRSIADDLRQSELVAEESSALVEYKQEQGELSLVEHLMELMIYYDVIDKSLEAERDYQLSLAQLEACLL